MRRRDTAAQHVAVQEFLERGFHAFRHMEDPTEFLDTIDSRETRILDRVYAQHPNPFDLDA